MSDEALKQHRDRIDAIDAELLFLINERATHARAIGEIKGGGLIYRPEREAQVLRRLKSLNEGPLSDESIARLFREVMSACLALEKPLSIAFLGPNGTHSEAAAVKHFGHAAVTVPCPSFEEIFRRVEAGACDYLVVPVENSTAGAVQPNLDLLLRTNLNICGEVQLRIHHHLLRKTPELSLPRLVFSHQQTLMQCHEWLNQNLPGVERVAVASNAEAARLAAEDPTVAAIAGEISIDYFGLFAVARCIEDNPNNTTRFLVLGHNQVPPSGQDKTSLALSTRNQPGAVYELLKPMAAAGISMTKFESRPSHTGLWEYVFFMDIDGHQNDSHVAEALQALKNTASLFKILGSYPVAVI